MCDSLVAVTANGVWLAKNSDREPDEAQSPELHPAAAYPAGAKLQVSDLTLSQARSTHALWISRPRWMWGCEMGVNARGLAVANEAVFTRMPVMERGVTGMDLQRLALERASTAEEALEVIVELLARHPQGGRMGHRDRAMRYHSSFILADAREAWILETAGALWAAQRVRGARTLSNILTIENDFDRIHPQALSHARARGWCRGAADFGFARCFARRFYRVMSGGVRRQACTTRGLSAAAARPIDMTSMASLLRDHADADPAAGWRMQMTCAHASWLPTRSSGQTTASMVAQLAPDGPRLWFTGTSSPCISVFKPVSFATASQAADDAPEGDSLWRQHERLHRVTLADYAARRAVYEGERAALELRAATVDPRDPAAVAEIWATHQSMVPRWTAAAAEAGHPGRSPFHRYWARKAQSMGAGPHE